MTTPHKWADVLHAIADGKDVQFQDTNDEGWTTSRMIQGSVNPITHPHLNWRIKPEMVRVGRHSWPIPLMCEPPMGRKVFIASAHLLYAIETTWMGNQVDQDFLSNHAIHLTKEAAEQHAAALRCINRGDVE